jgi:hypothetical protein
MFQGQYSSAQNLAIKEYTEIKETSMEIVNGELVTIGEQWEIAKNNEFQALNEQISDLKAGLDRQMHDTARKLKAMGDPVDKIAAATGLSPEEIQQL